MNYHRSLNTSKKAHDEFISWLSERTIAALKAASCDQETLQIALSDFLSAATAAGIDKEEIESILGVNDDSIMDLAELSSADEEILIDAFETHFNNINPNATSI